LQTVAGRPVFTPRPIALGTIALRTILAGLRFLLLRVRLWSLLFWSLGRLGFLLGRSRGCHRGIGYRCCFNLRFVFSSVFWYSVFLHSVSLHSELCLGGQSRPF
jgi:hypothetical protein